MVRTWVLRTAAMAAAVVAASFPTSSPALAGDAATSAAPTCTPGKPVVVGSAADRLTVTTPGCASDADVTGYRLHVYATAASTQVAEVDLALGVTQREVTGLQAGTLYRFRLGARNGDGEGPLGAASTDASPPFTSLDAMVSRQYLDFNGAAATATQRSTWLGELASGAKTPVDLVDAAEQFPFWQKQSPVIRLYQAYFLRLPDKSGLAYWVAKYRNGTKISDISQQFARSSEFTRRYGTLTNRQFVEQIYLNVLGRPGEESGIAYWTRRLDTKAQNRGQVMVGFSESSEYVRKTKEVVWTVNLFSGMVLRLPTSAEVTTWKTQTKAAQIAFLLGSSAYGARVAVAAPPAAPGIATASLPTGQVGAPYSATLVASGGSGGLTWTRPSGALPAGLSLSSGGTISGTPTAAGTATFAVTVTDGAGRSTTKTLSIVVSNFGIVTTSVPGGYVGVPYAVGLEAAGGTGYAWSISVGALPGGLALNAATGVISGTPTGTGTATFTAKVDAAGAKTASRQFTIAVVASADWPQTGHDGGDSRHNPGDGAISATNVAGIGEEWNLQAALQPAIYGELAYAAGEVPGRSGTNAPMAIDLQTGEVAWFGPALPSGCASGPVAVTAGAVIVQCGSLVAYSRTGAHQQLWSTADTDPGTTTQSLAIVGANAYAWGQDRVVAYRLSDGQRLWQQLIPSGATNVWDVAASGTNVVVSYNDRLRSLHPTTGAQQWSRPLASPGEVMIGGTSAYALVSGQLQRFALSDGAPVWAGPAGQDLYQLVGVDGDTAYAFEARFSEFGQETAVVRAFRTSDGSQRWEAQMSTRLRSSAITADLVWVHVSEIYRWGRSSAMVALRRSDGAELKRIEFEDNSYGSAAWGNGHVVFSQGGSFGGPDPYRLRSYGFTPPSPTIVTRLVPTGRVGQAYSAQLEATGGSGGLTWSITSGSLPSGLSLSAGGLLAGTPTGSATARVQVRVIDAKGRARSRPLNVWVAGGGTDAWSAPGQEGTRDGYNAAETSISRDTAAQLGFRWKTAVPAGTEQSSTFDQQPTVVGGQVIDVDKTGQLVAYSTAGTTANRQPLWTRPALGDAYYSDVPVESGGVLYLFDSARKLDAVRASDGVRLWQATVPNPPSQYQRNELLVVGSRILYLDGAYDLVARSTTDGSASWGGTVVPLDGNELSGSVVLASDGTRAFVVADCVVKAITIATGAVAWSVPVEEGGTTNCGVGDRMTPMVADGAVFATTYDGSIAIEAATGAVRWRAGIFGGYGNGGGAIANGAWILSDGGGEYGSLAAIDLRTGEVLWRQASAPSGASLAIAGDLVVARGVYELRAYDLLGGELLWDGGQVEPGVWSWGGPAIVGGRIFLATRDGISAYGPL